jgi:phosphatidylglycerophosphate synthase
VSSPALNRDDESVNAGKLRGTSLISESIIRWWIFEFMQPLETFFVERRIHPNTLTSIGLSLTVLGAILVAASHLIWGGWTIILAGCFDFFDGRVARRTNLVTKAGGFYDSILDRYMDSAVFFGLIFYFRDNWFLSIVLLAYLGTMLTPYIRAKVEALGMESKEGMMQRPERVLYIGLGSAFSGYLMCCLYPFYPKGVEVPPFLLMLSVSVVAVMSNLASFQRFKAAFDQLKSK